MLNPQIFHSIEFYAAKVESTIRFLNWLMDAVRTIRGLWQISWLGILSPKNKNAAEARFQPFSFRDVYSPHPLLTFLYILSPYAKGRLEQTVRMFYDLLLNWPLKLALK